MKHVGIMLLIVVLALIVAMSQYWITNIPGRVVFWPLMLISQICYLWQFRAKVF